MNSSRPAQSRRFSTADRGQAEVLTVLSLMALLLMVGLGVDVAYLRYQKQQMQKAADAGARAGAAALIYGGSYVTAGQNDAAANGFTNGSNGVVVTVNNPPQTAGDPFQNDSSYVEVIVAQARPTFFLNVGGTSTVEVRARAVASSVNSGTGCIYALDPNASDSETFLVDGSVGISSTCGICTAPLK